MELAWEIFFRTNLTYISVTTFVLSLEYFQKQPPEVLYKNVLKNLENSLENTCARASFFKKVASVSLVTLLKKRLWHRCFPANCLEEHLFHKTTLGDCFCFSTEEQFRDITKFTVDGKSEGNLNQNTLKTFM